MLRTIPSRAGRSRLLAVGLGVLLLAGMTLAGSSDAFAVPAWATSQVSSAMCKGSIMHLVATGCVAAAYERVYTVLMAPKILEDVAAAYQRELPAGAKSNLVVTPMGSNGRYTVDWKGERADVRDVWRQTDTNNFFEGGYIITGRRSFGSFETVMNLHLQRSAAGQADFRADVLIYPHNGLIRFIFNNLLSVEAYFRTTMDEMSADIRRVCTSLCQANTVPTAAAP